MSKLDVRGGPKTTRKKQVDDEGMKIGFCWKDTFRRSKRVAGVNVIATRWG